MVGVGELGRWREMLVGSYRLGLGRGGCGRSVGFVLGLISYELWVSLESDRM